jgi:hypothetical protein
MTAQNTRLNGAGLDLSPRVAHTATVVASPAAATETIIASLTLNKDWQTGLGVVLFGWAAFTVGTSGVSVVLRIRETNASGTVIASTGAVTYTAADLGSLSLQGLDAGIAPPVNVYVVTMTVASGAAESTVSAVDLLALLI